MHPLWCTKVDELPSCPQTHLLSVSYIPLHLLSISSHYLLSLLYFQHHCLSTGFSINIDLTQSPVNLQKKQINQPTNSSSKQATNQSTNQLSVLLELRHSSPFKVKLLRKLILASVSSSLPPFLSSVHSIQSWLCCSTEIFPTGITNVLFISKHCRYFIVFILLNSCQHLTQPATVTRW